MKKKGIILAMSAAILVSSCGTYAGEGAGAGAYLGSILGSAIGGISGGPRGSDVGTLIGMAGGAMVGAAVGSAADQAEQKKYEEYKRDRQQRTESRNNNNYGNYQYGGQDNSGFDPNNGGDDRIEFEGFEQPKSTTVQPTNVPVQSISVDQLKNAAPGYKLNYNNKVELRKALFNDADHDGIIKAGEECKLSFEIMNNSDETLYNVFPTVMEVTGNKHIHISPSLRIESIAPHSGVRYTATVYGDSRLKDGEAIINVSVSQGNRQLTTDIQEFRISTRR